MNDAFSLDICSTCLILNRIRFCTWRTISWCLLRPFHSFGKYSSISLFFLRFLLRLIWFPESVPRVLSLLPLIFLLPLSSRRTFLSLPHFSNLIFRSQCSVAHLWSFSMRRCYEIKINFKQCFLISYCSVFMSDCLIFIECLLESSIFLKYWESSKKYFLPFWVKLFQKRQFQSQWSLSVELQHFHMSLVICPRPCLFIERGTVLAFSQIDVEIVSGKT